MPVLPCPTAPFAPRSIHLITASRWLAFFSAHLLSFGPSLAVTAAAAAAAVYFNLVNVSLSLSFLSLFLNLGFFSCWLAGVWVNTAAGAPKLCLHTNTVDLV